jgi:prevent-host-death family protein
MATDRWAAEEDLPAPTMTATEARVHFGELMRRVVAEQTPIVVERGGKPQVVVLSIEEYKRLRAGQRQADWEELVDEARALVRADLKGRRLPPADEIIRAMREERDAQLLDLY